MTDAQIEAIERRARNGMPWPDDVLALAIELRQTRGALRMARMHAYEQAAQFLEIHHAPEWADAGRYYAAELRKCIR